MERVEAEQIATRTLDPGERLLWSGSPNPGRSAAQVLVATFIGIPSVGFAVFWIYTAYHIASRSAHAPGPWALFPLFGLPFLLIGLGVMLSPLWAYLAAQRTVYAVTDQRALISSSLGARGVRAYSHDDIGELSMVERADGSGDLFFANRTMVTQRGYASQRVGFIGIPEVRSVEQLLRQNLKEQRAA